MSVEHEVAELAAELDGRAERLEMMASLKAAARRHREADGMTRCAQLVRKLAGELRGILEDGRD